MKVAAFYENILEGAKTSGIPIVQAVRELMDEGLDLLYASVYSARDEKSGMPEVIRETGIGVEGLYGFFDFLYWNWSYGRCNYARSLQKI